MKRGIERINVDIWGNKYTILEPIKVTYLTSNQVLSIKKMLLFSQNIDLTVVLLIFNKEKIHRCNRLIITCTSRAQGCIKILASKFIQHSKSHVVALIFPIIEDR